MTDYKHAPAPWTLTGQGYIFLVHQPFSQQPVPLPAGAVAPLEAPLLGDRFHGGYGAVLIVRYDSSDVGPYDELMYIPGWFSSSEEAVRAAQYRHTITRIYVSTVNSVQNGRRNWGIPKHLAKFDFSPVRGRDRRTRIAVAHPNSPDKPFFEAVMTDSRLTPFPVPVSTSWVDSRLLRAITGDYQAQLVQPPLPSATDSKDSERQAAATGQDPAWLIGTQKTWLVKPESTGQSVLCNLEIAGDQLGGQQAGFGDGDSFPRFKATFGNRGIHLTTFKMQFVVPLEI